MCARWWRFRGGRGGVIVEMFDDDDDDDDDDDSYHFLYIPIFCFLIASLIISKYIHSTGGFITMADRGVRGDA